MYYIKILTERKTGFTLKAKFRRKDKALKVLAAINRRGWIDTRHWDRRTSVPQDYLQSRQASREMFEHLKASGQLI